jgi:hypothetical protein
LDALPATDPPAVIAAPTHPLAATENSGRTERERDLCERAAQPSWGYVALWGSFVGISLAVGSGTKYAPDIGVRMLGPGFIGLSWGGFVGGGYLALPKCHAYYAGGAPPEGETRTTIPIALMLATLAGASAPFIVGLDTGAIPIAWTTEERVGRLGLAAGLGFLGALIPYIPLFAPRTWRAARELEKLRIQPAERGAIIGWSATF